MSGRVLPPEELAGLAALETTPGPWRVSVMRGTVRAVSPGDPLPPVVVAERPPSGWLAEGDPDLLAAAQDLLATSQHLLQRAERAEERAATRTGGYGQALSGPETGEEGRRLADAAAVAAGWRLA